jgi:ketosteroid isomerase-like protein
MADINDLARRIDRLEARAAISELVSAYAVACDEHDMPRLTNLFTEDATFDSPSKLMVAQGRSAIAALFVTLFQIRGPAFHWTHDRFVAFADDDPNLATGLVLSHAETTPNGVVSIAAMRYEDVYRCEGGRWLFARRTINFLYYVPVNEFPNALNSKARLAVGAERRSADYPESLVAWQQFEREHGGTAVAE